jgi:hypothetical protein
MHRYNTTPKMNHAEAEVQRHATCAKPSKLWNNTSIATLRRTEWRKDRNSNASRGVAKTDMVSVTPIAVRGRRKESFLRRDFNGNLCYSRLLSILHCSFKLTLLIYTLPFIPFRLPGLFFFPSSLIPYLFFPYMPTSQQLSMNFERRVFILNTIW